ncbi:MAG: tetratricopeptide repeat protein [Desulfobacteraceae bacterium]|nr:tetratricopeptide repeat protein [Desulfobacteraceae bacterium]MDH3572475.1 tetratricopeptide repeat protein [Desulfobacteraceae bacterium]MDH3720216.1 tetratricopeptide repeat protein [Desulfobacteraceae bacterium]MDH3835262.1 tetratricopeptide repeat protein [Desulfobacteraceae bacterium]MDH3872910.1 tetratricopeptide repeat protein [Desulfobacteraceae bacterium]
MSRNRLNWTVLVMTVCCVVSCATANIKVQKKQGEALRNLGEEYYKQGDYTSALKELLKAQALYPDDAFLQNDLGLTYKAKKRLDLAAKHFRKALEIKPDYAPAKNNLGTVYLDKKEWDTAIKYFKEVSENMLYATPHIALANLGWAYYNKKEYTLSETYYLKALDLEPMFINAQRGLGLTYVAMGRIDEAVEIFEKAVKNYPKFALLYDDLAKVYVLLHDDEKALDAYQKVVELAPDSAMAREAEKAAQRIKRY